MTQKLKTKAAFVAIIGKPNVGKSTIMNKILGQKISIVSCKPQTTIKSILGIFTDDNVQLVFVDTPGIHKSKNKLSKHMNKSIKNSISMVDIVTVVVDANKNVSNNDLTLIKNINEQKIPVVLVINKIDTIKDKSSLIQKISIFSNECDLMAVIPISAKTEDGLDLLINELEKLSIESEHFFEKDALTDQPEKALAAEFIREKALKMLEHEIPHGIAVVIEKMKKRENKNLLDINAVIYCEKQNHKGIIIGKNGSMLKKIGTFARQDMEYLFNCHVNLNIWVKVKDDWRNNESLIKNFGYDFNKY